MGFLLALSYLLVLMAGRLAVDRAAGLCWFKLLVQGAFEGLSKR